MPDPSAGPTWADFVGGWELFRDPVVCGVAAGLVLGLLGVYIVLRRMVFVSATLSQTSGLGVALGFYAHIHWSLDLPPVLSAVLVSLVGAVLVSLDTRRLHVSRDSVLAFLWLLAGGGAILVGDRITQEAHDIAGILFGTAVLVRPADLYAVLGVGAVVTALTLWWHRGLVFAGFDPDGARVQGLPVRMLDTALLVMITVMVAVSTRALGALPVFAFSVLPGLAALLISPRLTWAFPLAALLGALSGGLGYLFAFFLSFPVGASQTAVAGLLVVLALPVRLLRGGD